jgi:hypothetical protein
VNHHLNDATLRQFIAHELPADSVLAVDDHLSECGDCRERLARLGAANARVAVLETGLLGLDAHLSEEDVQRYAKGDLSSPERADLDRHLGGCPSCAGEVSDLESFIRARSLPPRRYYLAAAAAVVLAILGAFAAGRWFSEPSVPGLASLPENIRGRVDAALRAGVAEPPDSLTGPPEVLMGAAETAAFRLLQPLGTVTVSDRPEFRWEPLAEAESYEVAVVEAERGSFEIQESVPSTSWTPAAALPRDRTYLWQVTARRSGESITVPSPPAPMARFRVMDGEAAEAIERLARIEPDSHLVIGVLCALTGARAEAESHLSRVAQGDPHFDTAQRTLERLREP